MVASCSYYYKTDRSGIDLASWEIDLKHVWHHLLLNSTPSHSHFALHPFHHSAAEAVFLHLCLLPPCTNHSLTLHPMLIGQECSSVHFLLRLLHLAPLCFSHTSSPTSFASICFWKPSLFPSSLSIPLPCLLRRFFSRLLYLFFLLFAEFFNSLLLIPTSSPSQLALSFFNLATHLPFPLPGWLSDAWAGTAGVAGQAAHLLDSCAAA